ncbi:(d)CMP kinase [bacterium]|nr:(d)CMP kinase [bacterium]
MRRKPVVALDGPVGVGKSTVARKLARRLGFLYIDTGAMYRAVALDALRQGVPLEDFEAVGRRVGSLEIRLVPEDEGTRVFCNGEDVTEAIRAPEVSRATSPIADNPAVRARLVALQRAMGAGGGVVMEGRDIGTVVFPDAEAKFYLDARAEIRAERRARQMEAAGRATDRASILADLLERDRRDRSRPVGALRVADGAEIVDTSDMSEDEVVEALAQRIVRLTFPRPGGRCP